MESERVVNILFVLPQLGAGGSERVVLDLARNLDRSNFKIYVAYFKKEGVWEDALDEVCEEHFYIPKKEGFDLLAIWHISRIIRERNISIINAHHYMSLFYCFLGAKIFNRRKLIFTEHSVPEVEAVYCSIHKNICRFILRQTDTVIGISNEITKSFIRNYPIITNKGVTFINGVDFERFSIAIDRNQERSKVGLSPKNFVVGIVANYRKIKNHACLLRALNHLKGKYPHLRLFFIGSGQPLDPESSEKEIALLIDNHGLKEYVILAGYQEDIPKYLLLFDVFCLPSFSEGLPLSVLEAMASGIPVVGSNVRGINEVIKDGETGLLFPSNDDEALSNILERLIINTDLCNELRINGYNYVQKTHNINTWVANYENLFKKMVSWS